MSTKKTIAYEKIKQLIVNNEIEKDAPLVERQLCEMLSISRTPIREALRELANENLVEIIEGKGVYVKKIDFRDMVELFEVREALEGMAVRLFTERMDEEGLEHFKSFMEEQKEAYRQENHKEFMDVDMKIHFLIAEGAKNGRLKNEIMVIYDQIKQIAISAKDSKEMRDTALDAHLGILDAVMARDPDAAQAAMVCHIKKTLELHKEKYYLL